MARILLRDLLPGTTYQMQLRAVNNTTASEWSQLFSLQTLTDTTPPDVPSWAVSNEFVSSGDAFVATWQPLNTGVEPNVDFSHYEINFLDTVGGSLNTTVQTTNTFYTLSFEDNRAYFGTPKAAITAKIRSVDLSGNVSAWSATRAATNPVPGNVASVTVTPVYDALEVTWPVVSGGTNTDITGYQVDISTTAAGSGYSTVWMGANNSYSHPTTAYATDHWVRVYAVDKFGQVSASPVTSSNFKPKSTFTVDAVAPAAPTWTSLTPAFDVTANESYFTALWAANGESDLQSYILRYGLDGSNWNYITIPSGTTTARVVVTPGKSYYFQLAARDFSANTSSYTNAPAAYPRPATADTTAPSQPAAPTHAANTLQIQVTHGGLKQAGGTMEADVVSYDVYAGTSANPTTKIGSMEANAVNKTAVGTFPIPASGGAATQNWIVRVKAIDSSGNASAYSNDSSAAGVALIAATNIIDATITNAKISDLSATKLTAGTITAQTINIGATGVLNIDSTGIIKSNNYSAGTAGYQLTNTSLEINNGSISAAALKIQVGNNVLPPQYADFEWASTFYLNGTTPVNLNWSTLTNGTITIDSTTVKFNSQSLKIVQSGATARTIYMAPNNTTNNIPFPGDGSTHFVSFWVNPSVTTALGNCGIYNGNTLVAEAVPKRTSDDSTTLAAGVWQQVYVMVASHATATSGNIRFNTPAVTGTWYFDGFQVEQRTTAIAVKPSPWTPPGVTTVDGGIIRTGEIRSTTNLTINTVTQPTWSINTAGAAQFGNLIVRGNVIVGYDVLEEDDSYIKSYNYSSTTGSEQGWKIQSDGIAEFRQVKANSFDGSAIKTSTLDVGTLKSSSLNSRIALALGSTLVAEGALGEEVSLSSAGFRVFGPDEVAITNKQILSNEAIITTAVAHNYVSGNTVIVSGVGSPFDGEYTISAVPTSNTFKYARVNVDIGSTATTGLAQGNSYGSNSGPKYIEFPTDGTQPNIISGTLLANTLSVSNGASLGGISTIESGAVVTLSNDISNPSTAPTITAKYNEKVLLGFTTATVIGATKGHDGAIWVLTHSATLTTGSFWAWGVTRHDASTGAYLSTVYSTLAVTGNTVLPSGIVYNPSLSRYYIIIGSAFASVDSGGTLVESGSYTVTAYNTSWVSQGSLAVESYNTGTADPARYYSKPILGWNYISNRLLVGFRNSSLGLTIEDWNVNGTTGVPTTVNSTYTASSSTGMSYNPAWIGYGNFDFNTPLLVYSDREYSAQVAIQANYYAWDTAGAQDVARSWPKASGTRVDASFWDSTNNRFIDIAGGNIREYAGGDSITGKLNTLTNRVVSGNVVTLTTAAAHDLCVGDTVVVDCSDNNVDGTFPVTSVPSTTTFTYAKTTGNVSGAVTGTAIGTMVKRYACYSWYDPNATGSTHETMPSPIASINLPKRAYIGITTSKIPYNAAAGTDAATTARVYLAHDTSTPTTGAGTTFRLRNSIVYPAQSATVDAYQSQPGLTTVPATSNSFLSLGGTTAPATIQSSDGASYWKSNNEAKFQKLILSSTQDPTLSAGNRPALIVGDYTVGGSIGKHLRIGPAAGLAGNEIFSMTADSTQGNLYLNNGGNVIVARTGGSLFIGGTTVAAISKFDWGTGTFTTDANGRVTVAHNMGTTPGAAFATLSANTTANESRQIVQFSRGSSNIVFAVKDGAGVAVGTGISIGLSWLALL